MKENRPFVHPFRTPGGYYIYDVNKNMIVKTQRKVWEIISDVQSDACDFGNENNLITKMLNDGFLSSKRILEIVHPADDILMYYLDRKINMITLQVTQQCNLRCDYCVYSGGYENRAHSKKRMDFDIAKRSIDFYIEHSIDSEFINIGFYGGEPLIEFELIKKCILYVESISEGKKLMFTMTTNGTLLKEDIVQFLEEHEVIIRISLDGPKEIHDRSRKFAFNNCGTFDKVIENVDMIKDKFPEYYKKLAFSTVLDQKNDLSCISQFFTDYDTVKDVNLFAAEIVDNYAKNDISVSDDYNCKIGYEHFKALLSKIISFDDKYISKIVAYDYENLGRIYKRLKITEGLPAKAHPGGPCIPGIQRLFISVDGDMFPCERVNESSEVTKIGSISTGFNLDKIRVLLNIGALSEDKCKNCWAFRFCTLCCANADTCDGLSGDKKTSKCHSVRNTAEYDLKDICTLKENSFDFDFSNWFITT
jgi:uncharacterized protein